MTAGLLLVLALDLDLLADSLLVSYLRYCELNIYTELGLELGSCYFNVLLAETTQYLLLCILVLNICECRILFNESLHTCGDLSLVTLCLSLDCH